MPDRVAQLGLTVELLVNNAGYSTAGKFVELNPEREVGIPPMVERGRGAVLNVASTIAFQRMPGQAGLLRAPG